PPPRRAPSSLSPSPSSLAPSPSSLAPSPSSLAAGSSSLAASSSPSGSGPKPEASAAGPGLFQTSDILEHIASRGEPPPATARSGRLDNAPNGAAIIHDRVTTITVARDGTAHFRDKPDISIHFRLPIPTLDGLRHALHDAGNAITEWQADP